MKKILLLCSIILGTVSYAQVSFYGFSQTTGTYTPITGGVVLGDKANDEQLFVDSAVLAGGSDTTGVGFPIGFNFTYDGVVFDRVAIDSNGWISLGQSSLTPSVDIYSSSSYSPLSSYTSQEVLLRCRIAALGDDLSGQEGSELMIQTIGTAPNRSFIVQWKGYTPFSATGYNLNFQIQLHETTNLVSIVYGAMTFAGDSSYTRWAQVGLGGKVESDFNNRATSTDWNATTKGVSSYDDCWYNASITAPATGTTFTYTPAEACTGTPLGGTVSNANLLVCIGSYIEDISVTGGTVATGMSYQWEQSLDGGNNYFNVDNGSNFNSITYYPPKYTGTPIQYKLKSTCNNSHLFAYSTVCTVGTAASPVANAGTDKTKPCDAGVAIGVAAVAGTTYSWSPSLGLSSATEANPTASPTITATFKLTATLTSSGCKATDDVVVTVNNPVANAGSDRTICTGGDSKEIGVPAETGVTYSWSPATGLSSSTVSNPIANPSSTTTYTLTATHTASGCISTGSVKLKVSTTPTAPTITAGGETSFCAGGSVSLTSSDANTRWYRSDIPVSVKSDILGTTGTFPSSITVDSEGNIYTANFNSDNVSKITPDGVSTILGKTGRLPMAITIDAQGNIYTANFLSDDVSKITPDGVSTILGTTGIAPYAIAMDAQGNIYTANNYSDDVSKITPAGVSTILGFTGAAPQGIAIDDQGNVYTANFFSNDVTKLSPAGVKTTFSTTGEGNWAIVLDAQGNIYTANYESNNVSKITPAGVSSIVGKTGTKPNSIAIDAEGNIYTTNFESDNISKITAAGVSAIIGSTGKAPYAIALDAVGNIYSANSNTNNVSKISTNTSVSHTVSSTATDVGTSNAYRAVVVNADGCSAYAEMNVTVKSANPTIIYRAKNVFKKDAPIYALTPEYLGCTASTGYSISSALPTGLTLDTTTGVISGTPTVLAVNEKFYTVTATNANGTGTFELTIKVTDEAQAIKPLISYETPKVYTVNTAITPLSPTNTGGAIESYSISPALPSGLVFNSTTGVISGSSKWIRGATLYTVSATNTAGVGTATIIITISDELNVTVDRDNYKIESKGEACSGKKNGSVKITAKKAYNYTATIDDGAASNFENNVYINESLAPGNHKVVVGVLGNTSYKQLFDIVIPEATSLTAKSSLNNNRLAVNIDKGTSPYAVSINGDEQFETEATSFAVLVEKGDVVEVKSSKLCEGVYSKTIDDALGNILACYPNPTLGGFEVAMPENTDDNAEAQIFSMGGQLISSGTYAVKNGKISLSLDGTPDGMYVVKVYSGSKEYILKVIKK